jgi:hypothetical protein
MSAVVDGADFEVKRLYARLSKRGKIHKPGKMWRFVEKSKRERISKPLADKERRIIQKWEDHWDL